MISWPTELMDVDELASRTAAFNPRTITKAARSRLKASMDEFGMAGTIIYNETTQTVLGGHQRLALLQEAGVQKVAVTVVTVPQEKEAALCVVLNREDAMGSWDRTRLDDLLAELAGSGDLLESLKLDELPEFRASDTDRLLERILEEKEWTPGPHDVDPEALADAIASKIRAIPQGHLGRVLLLAVSAGCRDVMVLANDPSLADFASEVRHAAESGSPSPLSDLFSRFV